MAPIDEHGHDPNTTGGAESTMMNGDNTHDNNTSQDASSVPASSLTPVPLRKPSSQPAAAPPASIRQGWFTELETMWPGQKFSLALEEFSAAKSVLVHASSDFQEILVFRSAQYGNVLALDGVIQLTERDEFAFHEMLVHVPIQAALAHAYSSMSSTFRPLHVCVVGGGDGACVRELVRYPPSVVARVVVVEIDPLVVQVAREHFQTCIPPYVWQDDRVSMIHQDAAAYLAQLNAADMFDVILGDTSDPVGPAASLFQPTFYDSLHHALKSPGIVCMQAESFWIHLDLISDLVACCADIFDTAEYATTMVPTLPCGQLRRKQSRYGVKHYVGEDLMWQLTHCNFFYDVTFFSIVGYRIGFVLACKGRTTSCRNPPPQRRGGMNGTSNSPTLGRAFDNESLLQELQWYSPEQHTAAFVLPPFVEERLEQKRQLLPPPQQPRCLLSPRSVLVSHASEDEQDDDYYYNHDRQQHCFFLSAVARWFRNI